MKPAPNAATIFRPKTSKLLRDNKNSLRTINVNKNLRYDLKSSNVER